MGKGLGRRAATAALAAWATLAASARSAPATERRRMQRTPVALPEPALQVAAGPDGSLLAVGRSGRLWRAAPGALAVTEIADGVDGLTPLAVAEGHIAGRRSDGALWVLDGGRLQTSAALALAPEAGLLLLADGVIAVAAANQGVHNALRLQSRNERWHVTARGNDALLPDARPVLAALDGQGAHIAVLAGPDSQRYPHGVLGDRIEATQMLLLDRATLAPLRRIALGPDEVFEDISQRRVSLGAQDGLLTVISGPTGGRLALIAADPQQARALEIRASGEPIGTRNRWMSPSADGPHWMSVHTPHIGGVLHEYKLQGSRLVARRLRTGVSTHKLGSRVLDMGSWHEGRLLLPDQAGTTLLLLDSRQDWASVAELALPSPVAATVALGAPQQHAVLLADGQVLRVSHSG